MLTPSQVQFLTAAASAAVSCEKITGVPAALTVAQAVFESGWGSHCPGCNCFGIKANGRGCGTQLQSTRLYVCFYYIWHAHKHMARTQAYGMHASIWHAHKHTACIMQP